VVVARIFCPPDLLAHYGTLSPTAAAPYMLTEAFSDLAAAQQPFPKSTAAGDLTAGTFTTNSLEWAVWNEATRYCESTTSLRTVLVDEGAYGIAGTLNPHTGIMFVGQKFRRSISLAQSFATEKLRTGTLRVCPKAASGDIIALYAAVATIR
jgi:hypothetical protein